MSTLLHIDSSGQNDASLTRRLSAYYVSEWQKANPGSSVIHRNLLQSKLPFVTEDLIGAVYTPPENLSEQQKRTLEIPNELMFELLEADTYVLGVPMYNFTVPGIFKTYIDTIVRPGLTFSYENGRPEGLLKNKKAIVITASGADFTQDFMKPMDFLEPYLRTILGFIGVTDVEFIKVSGRDPESKAAAEALGKNLIAAEFQKVAVAK